MSLPIWLARRLGGRDAGMVALAVTTSFDKLPSDVQIPPTAQVSFVYAKDGRTLLTTFYDENRKEVPLTQVATVMQQAIVAAEDVRFYQHGGVDLRAVARSLVADLLGGRIEQGASTLTMQYVRNVLKEDPNLTPQQRLAATADTPARKLQEIRYAMALETRLSKQEILDRYLNIAYFGAGAYGIYAASQTYFGVLPSQLTLAQAALLAGLVQSPDADSVIGGDRDAAMARGTYVLEAMAKAAMITPAQAGRAESEPLTVRPHQIRNGCVESTHAAQGWGFFCDYLRQWWDTRPEFGTTPQECDRALHDGGYTIVTSLDPAVQAAAMRQSLAVYIYGSRHALPIAAVQPGTGRVLAMAVNRHYSLAPNPKGQVNRPNTVNQLIAGGGSVTGYEAGSTFKLFTMLAALTDGFRLDTSFDAPSPLVTRWPASGPGSCQGYYCPVNDNPRWMDGHRTMWDGFGRSVNTYFVWLEEQIGPERRWTWREDSASRSGPRRTRPWRGVRQGTGVHSRSGCRTRRPWTWRARTRRSRQMAGTVGPCRSSPSLIRPANTSWQASPNATRWLTPMWRTRLRTRRGARSGSSPSSAGATVEPRVLSQRSSAADRSRGRPEARRATRPRRSSA